MSAGLPGRNLPPAVGPFFAFVRATGDDPHVRPQGASPAVRGDGKLSEGVLAGPYKRKRGGGRLER